MISVLTDFGDRVRHQMGEHFKTFIKKGSPIIGICNGFQVLTKFGLLPDMYKERCMALAPNIQGCF